MSGRPAGSDKIKKATELIERFPNLSKSALGRILYSKFPGTYRNEDDARHVVRDITESGVKTTSKLSITDKWVGPLKIQPGKMNKYSPVVVKSKKAGILCDIHIPYHNKEALTLALKKFKKEKVDTIILNGDLMDCHMLSSFSKEFNAPSFLSEVETTIEFLDDLRSMFPTQTIIYVQGNHEDRLDRFYMQKAPEVYGFPSVHLPALLELDTFGIKWVNNKRMLKLGKLNVIHGHEFGESVLSPVNPARGFYMRGKSNVIAGHYHRTSEHTEPDMNDNVVGAWSVGCLCDLHPKYRPLNKWNLGFALVEVDASGQFRVHNYRIIDGKVL